MRLVNVLVLAPGEDAPMRVERIDGHDYRELQRLVEGNLRPCSLPYALRVQNWFAQCARTDRRSELNRFALHLGHAVLRGPIVITKVDYMGEPRSLNRAELAFLRSYLAGVGVDKDAPDALR